MTMQGHRFDTYAMKAMCTPSKQRRIALSRERVDFRFVVGIGVHWKHR
jgi:hypothetical protein